MRSPETAADGTARDVCFLLCLVAVGKWGTKTNRADTSGEEGFQKYDITGSKPEPLLSASQGSKGCAPGGHGPPALHGLYLSSELEGHWQACAELRDKGHAELEAHGLLGSAG